MTREEAIKLIEHISMVFIPTDQYGDYDDPEPYEQALTMAIEALSADAVPFDVQLQSTRGVIDRFAEDRVKVVRCKECRFYSNDHLCEQLSRFGSIEPLADFYCAFGERREP